MKSILKAFAVAACAMAMGLTGAAAQTQELISNPRGIVANFDPPNLGPVLTELGIVWQERQDSQGRPFIAASIGGQLSFNIIPTACLGANNTNCIGMNMLALYGGSDVNAQTVSAFNQKYFFISAGSLANNAGAFISRYEIADYGIPRGNVASSFSNFVYVADLFMKQMSSGANTVSLDGYLDDMAASALNAKVAKNAGFEAMQAHSEKSLVHRAGFEETPELVRRLMESDNAPHNKIRNIE